MTVDDEKSIYIGGIPYNCSEDIIRKAFDPYGQIVAVKIVNDHDIGGKCYGFVTFLNPRSAVDAIIEMNGKKIAGRVVKVNEVRTRGARPHFNQGNSRPDTERNLDLDRDRNRERGHDHDRDRHRDRSAGRSRDRDWEWGREYEHPRGYDRSKDRFEDENHNRDVEREGNKQEYGRKQDRTLGRDIDVDWDRDREVDRNHDHVRRENHKDKDQQSNRRFSSRFSDRRSRELSSNPSNDYQDQVKEQVELSVQNHENLQHEISQVQKKLDERERYVLDLQKRSQKLEDALAVAKKNSSQKRIQLYKLQRCILQVNDYTEKLKSSELELQSLVHTIMVDADDMDDAEGMAGFVYINGKA